MILSLLFQSLDYYMPTNLLKFSKAMTIFVTIQR